jgi:hypothetical protein
MSSPLRWRHSFSSPRRAIQIDLPQAGQRREAGTLDTNQGKQRRRVQNLCRSSFSIPTIKSRRRRRIARGVIVRRLGRALEGANQGVYSQSVRLETSGLAPRECLPHFGKVPYPDVFAPVSYDDAPPRKKNFPCPGAHRACDDRSGKRIIGCRTCGSSIALLTSQFFLVIMMLGGAVGFYLGIDIPPLAFHGSGQERSQRDLSGKVDSAEFLSAVGTFLAATAVFASVSVIVIREDTHVFWTIMIMLGWVVGGVMQIAAGAIARIRA